MVDASLGVYFFGLFAAFVASGVYAFRNANGVTSRQKKARIAFWLFITCNALAEYITVFCLHPRASHDHIYSYSILVHTACLFIFYALLIPKRPFLALMICAWLLVLYVFIRDKHWLPESPLRVSDICSYFALCGFVTLIFLLYNLKAYAVNKGSFRLQLAIISSVYYPLAFLITSLIFTRVWFNGAVFFTLLSFFINTIYYSSVAFISFKHIKKERKHVA